MRLVFTLALVGALWVLGASRPQPTPAATAQGTEKSPKDVYVFAENSKLGKVTFSHLDHVTKNRNLDATGPVACVECHHTAQPASELARLPPLKTAYPPDRTTTLTAELLLKEPNTLGGVTCHKCHSAPGTKPEAWPANPEIKHETSTAVVTLTSQQAFHRNCAGCHDEVVKHRKDLKPPTSMKCNGCHKK